MIRSVSVTTSSSQPTNVDPAQVAFFRDRGLCAEMPAALEVNYQNLLSGLPPLSELVISTSREHRDRLGGILTKIGDGLESIRPNILNGEPPVAGYCGWMDQIIYDRLERGRQLFVQSEIPLSVAALSVEDQRELARAMEHKRELFWTKLYEAPFIQQKAIEILESLETKQGIVATILSEPRTEEYRKASKSERNAVLLNRAREALQKIRELGDGADEGVGSTHRQKIAAILVKTPLAPERALTLASECKRKAQAIIDAEIKSGLGGLADDYLILRKEFGASALQVRGFVAELTRLEEPYVRLKNYMVMSVAALAGSVASRKSRPNSGRKEDLFQSGIIGIMRGVERFDPGYGNALTTTTFNWITQAIGIERSADAFPVSMPRDKQQQFFKIRTQSERAGTSQGVFELATTQGIPEEDARAFNALLYPVLSFAFHGDSGRGLDELITDRKVTARDDRSEKEELRHRVLSVLKILKPLERKILSMHFGLDGADRLDDSEISARLNVSVERVKRFRKDSLWRLSRHSDAKAIKELYDSRSL